MRFFDRLRSLETKFLVLLLPTLAVVAVCFSVVYGLYVYRITERESITHVNRVADMLAEHVVANMENTDGHTLHHSLQISAIDEHVRTVTVFDQRGNRVAHYEPRRTGRTGLLQEHDVEIQRPLVRTLLNGNSLSLGSLVITYNHDHQLALALRHASPTVLSMFVLLFSVGIGVVWLNRRLVVAPMRVLTDTLDKAHETGRFLKAEWTSNDEVGRAIAAFNEVQDLRQRDQAVLERNRSLLAESENRFSTIAESIPIPLVIEWLSDGDIFYANMAAKTTFLTGDKEKAAPHMVSTMIADDDVRLAISDLLTRGGSVADRETLLLCPDGRRIWGLIAASLIDLEGRRAILYVIQDISTQKEAELALHAAKEVSDRANGAKDIFLSNAGHEIRTPLNAILGLSHLLQSTKLSKEQWDHANGIHTAGHLLLGLVEDVLDFSSIGDDSLALRTAPFLLSDVINGLAIIYSTETEAKGLTFEVDETGVLPAAVRGDSLRLSRVLNNLLENAVAFTEKGGITLSVHGEPSDSGDTNLSFAVHDTGVGMDSATVHNLFQPFVQADSSQSRTHQGIGLGLSIVRDIVKRMDSRINVETSPGEGTTFSFTVALPTADAAEAEKLNELPRKTTLTGKRILLVEDNTINRIVAEKILRGAGAAIEPAESGLAALAAMDIGGDRFDAVLMDLQMPEMDGHEATRNLRANFSPEDLPIIALTANANADERTKCLAEGMNDYLTKPIDPDRLIGTLARHMEDHTAAPLAGLPSDEADVTEQGSEQARIESDDEKLPGLNLADAMSRMGGDMALYKELLHMFHDMYTDGLKGISVPLSEGNHEDARRAAHSLKGVAGNISAFALHKAATALEKAIKEDRSDEEVDRLLDVAEQELAPVLETTRQFT